MPCCYKNVLELAEEFGSPFYIFDEQKFRDNYRRLLETFRSRYELYNISYSYKTNYTPYIAKTVKDLGGYAEVVSEMEYHIAKKLGYEDNKIIFNGPDKGQCGITAFLRGSLVNADSLCELDGLLSEAAKYPDKSFSLGLRVNLDLGQSFISRFGIDEEQLDLAFRKIEACPNVKAAGLHCHISRCRGLEAWEKRAQIMLALADKYFPTAPDYIDLGSGMFGSMEDSFAAQFENVPDYGDYAEAVAGAFARHYKNSDRKPLLFTEPGTTLVNRYVELYGKVNAIKELRGKYFAVFDCSIHNLGETSTLKELPVSVFPCPGEHSFYESIDFAGYTCLEQDIMRRSYRGELAVGDFVRFGNVGGYSNVLKPPFIRPNCAMAVKKPDGSYTLIKKAECFDDLLRTYIF